MVIDIKCFASDNDLFPFELWAASWKFMVNE